MENVLQYNVRVLRMGQVVNPTVNERLTALRKRAGLSMGALAIAIGYRGASSYQHYEDPEKFRKPYLPLHLAERLAEALVSKGEPPIRAREVLELAGPIAAAATDDTADVVKFNNARTIETHALRDKHTKNKPSAYQNGNVTSGTSPSGCVRLYVGGPVQGGVWQELPMVAPDEGAPTFTVFEHPLFRGYERLIQRQVIGDSVSNYVEDGGYIVTVPYEDFGTALDGRHVVVEREDGGRVERTLKLYRRNGDGDGELWGNSKDQRWNDVVPLTNGMDDEAKVRIIEVCITAMTPR